MPATPTLSRFRRRDALLLRRSRRRRLSALRFLRAVFAVPAAFAAVAVCFFSYCH